MIVLRTERKKVSIWSTVNWWEEGHVQEARDHIVSTIIKALKNSETRFTFLASKRPTTTWNETKQLWLLSWDVDITTITDDTEEAS